MKSLGRQFKFLVEMDGDEKHSLIILFFKDQKISFTALYKEMYPKDIAVQTLLFIDNEGRDTTSVQVAADFDPIWVDLAAEFETMTRDFPSGQLMIMENDDGC